MESRGFQAAGQNAGVVAERNHQKH